MLREGYLADLTVLDRDITSTPPVEIQDAEVVLTEEVIESLVHVLDKHPECRATKILERIIGPERVIMFRAPWVDDQWI